MRRRPARRLAVGRGTEAAGESATLASHQGPFQGPPRGQRDEKAAIEVATWRGGVRRQPEIRGAARQRESVQAVPRAFDESGGRQRQTADDCSRCAAA